MRWSDELVEEFKDLASKYHYKEVAKMINMSESAVENKARRLKIKLITSHVLWNDEDKKYLKDSWGKQKIENIAKHLNKTVEACMKIATQMKLGPMIDGDKEILRIKDICEILNMPYNTVKGWMNQGLKFEIRYVTNTNYFYYVTWPKFLNFLKNNPDKWDSKRVDLYMLGEEYPWLKEKRKKDLLEPVKRRNNWTTKEIKIATSLVSKGKSYKEISKVVNHTTSAVAKEMQINSLGTHPNYFWKVEEIEYIKENYATKNTKEIANYLNRTVDGVHYQARKLKLKKAVK